MGQIKLTRRTQNVGGTQKVVTSQTRYSTISSDELIDYICESAKIKKSAAKQALLGLKSAVSYLVVNGHHVNLGDFGYLKVSINAAAVKKAHQVSADLVKHVSLAYQPSTKVKALLESIEFSAE